VHAVLVQVIAFAFRPGLSYAVLDAGGSVASLGLLGAAVALPALLLAIPTGRVADRFGERGTGMLGAVFLIGAGLLALSGSSSIALLLLSAVLIGIGHLLSVVSEQAIVANRSIEGARETAFGIYALATSFGQVLGPLLLSVPGPADEAPWLAFLFLSCAAVGVAVLLTSSLVPSSHVDRSEPRPGMLASSRSLLRSDGVVIALISGTIALSSIDIALTFWPALAEERGLPAATVSAMLVARSLGTMASRSLVPALSRRIRRSRLLTASLVLAGVFLAMTAAPFDIAVVVGAAAAFGIAIGVCQPITMAWLADEAHERERGIAVSLRLAGNRIGQATIPVAVSTIAPAAGAVGVVMLSAVTLLVASGLTFGSRNRGTGARRRR
jgi:MFS family permease